MEIERYRAAGGVVIQKGILPSVNEETAYVLLLERPQRREVRLPKGHIEPGEAPKETALRETVEEAGYADLRIATDLGSQVVEFDYNGRHYVRQEHYFLMLLETSRRVSRNSTDAAQFNVRWVPLADAAQQLTFDAEQNVVERAIARYRELTGGD